MRTAYTTVLVSLEVDEVKWLSRGYVCYVCGAFNAAQMGIRRPLAQMSKGVYHNKGRVVIKRSSTCESRRGQRGERCGEGRGGEWEQRDRGPTNAPKWENINEPNGGQAGLQQGHGEQVEGGGQGLAKNSVDEMDRPRIPLTLVLQERTQPIETTLCDPSSTAPGILPGGSVPLPM
jgi:hypothetical protein